MDTGYVRHRATKLERTSPQPTSGYGSDFIEAGAAAAENAGHLDPLCSSTEEAGSATSRPPGSWSGWPVGFGAVPDYFAADVGLFVLFFDSLKALPGPISRDVGSLPRPALRRRRLGRSRRQEAEQRLLLMQVAASGSASPDRGFIR